MKFFYLGFIIIICQCNCQEYRSLLAGQDYILRSCISTAELVRNHRKIGKDEKIITSNNVGEFSEIKEIKEKLKPSKELRSQLNERGKGRRIEETPLRTLNIRRDGKFESLSFTRKRAFPVIPPSKNQQKLQRDSEIIIIQSRN